MAYRGKTLFTIVLSLGSIVGCKTSGSQMLSNDVVAKETAKKKTPYFSAMRRKNEDFRAVLNREKAEYLAEHGDAGGLALDGKKTVDDAAVDLGMVDYSKLPVWTTQQLEDGFKKVRDFQYLYDQSFGADSSMVRRMSWLYPDDGCFARASQMGRVLQDAGYPRPRKVFTIGNLHVQSANAALGEDGIYWGYHVAPLVKVGTRYFVLDPSIQPSAPMTLGAWVDIQDDPNDDRKIRVAVCDENAYTPIDTCIGSDNDDDDAKSLLESEFLGKEWERQLQLHDGSREIVHALLGPNPPWSKSETGP